jgi:hypothetical protein
LSIDSDMTAEIVIHCKMSVPVSGLFQIVATEPGHMKSVKC